MTKFIKTNKQKECRPDKHQQACRSIKMIKLSSFYSLHFEVFWSTVHTGCLNSICAKKKLIRPSKIKRHLYIYKIGKFMPTSSVFIELMKGRFSSIRWFVTWFCLKMTPKIRNNSKLANEQKIFENWTIDGAQHQFNKTRSCRHKCLPLMSVQIPFLWLKSAFLMAYLISVFYCAYWV